VVPTVASAIDVVVHLGVRPDGVRQVREIVAVTGRVEEGRVETAGLFHRLPDDRGGELVRGDGFPPGPERFARAGIDVRALLASGAAHDGAGRGALDGVGRGLR
jgi:pilus assembly protein CpaF